MQPSDYIIYDKFIVRGQGAPSPKQDSVFSAIRKHSTFEDVCNVTGHLFPGINFNHVFISRNPYSRIKSAFTFLKGRYQSGALNHMGISYNMADMSFLDFLSSSIVGKHGRKAAHPQSLWLPSDSNIPQLIFKLESFSSDEKLNEFINYFSSYKGKILPNMFSLKHSNKSSPSSAPISDESACIDIVNDLYDEDFRRFSYSKQRLSL